jgi:glutathione synthase/RimK-type ligase-like ATP-grasp enzyme
VYKTLIVVDNENQCLNNDNLLSISFEAYLRDYPKRQEPKTRVINLCDTGIYLSKGYYCSLLAEAREHSSLPSVKTINELRDLKREGSAFINLKRDLEGFKLGAEPQSVMVYFGYAENFALQKVAKKVFTQYPAPILKISFWVENGDLRLRIEDVSFSALDEQQNVNFLKRLSDYTESIWRKGQRKLFRWDMAILVNSQEKVPPSNKEAIARFIKAASKHGINAETVEADKLQYISQYDALFIRETTGIDHYTYRLACRAENSGLVVMDDPTSILRCCNKVYLQDAFSYQNVPCLRTRFLSDQNKETLDELEASFGYPLVLKMPEGSFSRGVFRISDRAELIKTMALLFQESALVLAQEYLYTKFDWRVGVLNGRAVYACRYLMARDHWQIYNHSSKRFNTGGFETVPTFEVPKVVLDAALKASKVVGNGLYGVDIKQVDNYAYVLEVNDNPSIDHKVEDAYLGDELYMLIMSEFQQRLEKRGR